MKKIVCLIAALGLLMVVLAGCASSDLTLTVQEDGSFHAELTYRILKEFVATDEAMEQVKTLFVQQLEEAGIPYSVQDTDEAMEIHVTREFADWNALTDAESWSGLTFAPRFSATGEENAVAVRVQDGVMTLSGDLTAETFHAKEFVDQTGSAAHFSGTLTVVLPEKAAEANVDGDGTYTWSGTAEETVPVSVSWKTTAEDTPEVAGADGPKDADEPKTPDEDEPKAPEGGHTTRTISVIICAALGCALLIGVIARARKK